ncbi:MAG TPA: hypothetical protein VLA93_06470 [Pyrinomonadaceae bacterium]|nr:hypothetical protein [Pyrinomonadaceae bacterium]
MNMRMMLGAMMFIAAAIPGNAQTSQQPAGTPSPQAIEQRVANEIKEKQLRKEAEEKLAVEESNRIARLRPEELLSSGRTFYIYSDTDFFEEVQLQNALRKRTELSDWQLSILDGWKSREVADVWVEVDRPLFTYTFTYQLIHRSTGKVLATGKVTAFDGNLAAPKLAARIIQDIKKAKESPKKQ